MNKTLDHIHFYVRSTKSTKRILASLEKSVSEGREATIRVLDLRTHVNIRSDPSFKAAPLWIYQTISDAMKKGQKYDMVLAIQKYTRPGVPIKEDRGLYKTYQTVHQTLHESGIPCYCPNPPSDLRKDRRKSCLN